MSRGAICLAIAALLMLAACQGSPSATSTGAAILPSESPSPIPTGPAPSLALPEELRDSEAVAFTTNDGLAIEGRLFGSADVGVVLAHGSFESGQQSSFAFARVLADEGYRVLTLNLRGFCPGGINGCSGGTRDPPEMWSDVAAAAEYLGAHGTGRVFLMGTSLGARASLWAASRPGVDVAGVIGVSTPLRAVGANSPAYDFTAEIVRSIEEPKLFLAGDLDEDYAAQAQTLYGWASEPRHLTIASSSRHGPALLSSSVASAAVFDFLNRYR